MTFTDFKPEELIGRKVLHESGQVNASIKRRITTITRVTATAFAVDGSDQLFRLSDGERKGISRKESMWGSVGSCKLLTEEEAKEIAAKWANIRRTKKAIEAIEHEVKSGRPTLEQLEAACVALGLTK